MDGQTTPQRIDSGDPEDNDHDDETTATFTGVGSALLDALRWRR